MQSAELWVLARKYYTTVGQWLAPADNKHQITVGTGLAPVRKILHVSQINGQPQGLSLRVYAQIFYNFQQLFSTVR